MIGSKVPPGSASAELAGLLDSPEIARLIAELEETRWTGRPGYPIRAMVGLALVKSLYAIPTWTRTVALVHEHAALQAALGCAPSVYAAYRFSVKLRTFKPLLDACLDRVTGSPPRERPRHRHRPVHRRLRSSGLRERPAVRVSKGGRERSDDEFSDPDASWGHRSAVSTRRPGVSMASGGSPGPTQSAARPSGAARPASASPRADGSRPVGSTRWSRARPCAGASSTRAVPLWSASSVASRTSGRCYRFASEGLSGSSFTRT